MKKIAGLILIICMCAAAMAVLGADATQNEYLAESVFSNTDRIVVSHQNAVKGGTWKESSLVNYDNGKTLYTGTSGNSITYPISVAQGMYDLYIWTWQHTQNSDSMTFAVNHAGKTDNITIYHKTPDGGNNTKGWVKMGNFDFKGLDTENVSYTHNINGTVRGTAIMLVKTGEISHIVLSGKTVFDQAMLTGSVTHKGEDFKAGHYHNTGKMSAQPINMEVNIPESGNYFVYADMRTYDATSAPSPGSDTMRSFALTVLQNGNTIPVTKPNSNELFYFGSFQGEKKDEFANVETGYGFRSPNAVYLEKGKATLQLDVKNNYLGISFIALDKEGGVFYTAAEKCRATTTYAFPMYNFGSTAGALYTNYVNAEVPTADYATRQYKNAGVLPKKLLFGTNDGQGNSQAALYTVQPDASPIIRTHAVAQNGCNFLWNMPTMQPLFAATSELSGTNDITNSTYAVEIPNQYIFLDLSQNADFSERNTNYAIGYNNTHTYYGGDSAVAKYTIEAATDTTYSVSYYVPLPVSPQTVANLIDWSLKDANGTVLDSKTYVRCSNQGAFLKLTDIALTKGTYTLEIKKSALLSDGHFRTNCIMVHTAPIPATAQTAYGILPALADYILLNSESYADTAHVTVTATAPKDREVLAEIPISVLKSAKTKYPNGSFTFKVNDQSVTLPYHNINFNNFDGNLKISLTDLSALPVNSVYGAAASGISVHAYASKSGAYTPIFSSLVWNTQQQPQYFYQNGAHYTFNFTEMLNSYAQDTSAITTKELHALVSGITGEISAENSSATLTNEKSYPVIYNLLKKTQKLAFSTGEEDVLSQFADANTISESYKWYALKIAASDVLQGDGTTLLNPQATLTKQQAAQMLLTILNRNPYQTVLTNGSWQLAFEDNFNGTAPDTDKWTMSSGQYSTHIASYRSKNEVKVENGTLKLLIKKDPWTATVDGESYSGEFKTGNIVSKAGDFSYGYYEASYRYPVGTTTNCNNSFWLTHAGDAAQGQYMEIDINEGRMPNMVYANYHYNVPNGEAWETKHANGSYASQDNLYDGFHRYGLLWTENSLTWYFDGTPIYTCTITQDTPQFDMKLYFSLALMKIKSGGTELNLTPENVQAYAAEFDHLIGQSMDVDWVRYYKPAQ